MSGIRKLSHIIWIPKYRFRILVGAFRESVEEGIHAICGYTNCGIVEQNVQGDHVHMVVMVPPKVAISDFLGRLKGQSAMKLFRQFRQMRKKPY